MNKAQLIMSNGLLIVLLTPCFIPEVLATPQSNSWYIGAKAGRVNVSGACGSHASTCDDLSIGSGLFVGYVANDWLGLEAGYDHVSDVNIINPMQNTLTQSEVNGLSIVAKPYWRLNDNWSVFGKAGLMLGGGGDTDNMLDSSTSPLLGAGLKYAFNRNWSSSLEYQWTSDVSNDALDSSIALNQVNLAISYHFANKQEDRQPTSMPETPVYTERPWYFSGAPFSSDASRLSMPQQHALQPVIERLRNNSHAKAQIDTHADARGTTEYNQKLTNVRANEVKKYLIKKGALDMQLQVAGHGEAQPIADNKTEMGRSQNRRIEVRIYGLGAAADVTTPNTN